MNNNKRIGLFFGTFNPIHIGHLIIANTMATHTDLDKVWFVVSPRSPAKSKTNLLHEFDRYDLVKAAISDNWKLEVSDVEFHLPKPSYTIHSLVYLSEQFPQYTFKVILGEDNLRSFLKWKNYTQILQQYGLYVYRRLGSESSPLLQHINVKVIDSPQLNISATYIRRCIQEKKSIQYIVPEPVEDLIRIKKLYH